MKKSAIALVLIAVCFGPAVVGKEISEKDVPVKVREAFTRDYPGSRATAYERELTDGLTLYEIETRAGGVELDVFYTADGTLFATEKKVNPKSLPQPLIDAIRKSYPDWQVQEVSEITRGSSRTYEIELRNAERSVEIALTTEGAIRELPAESDDSEEADDEE